jgi:hypothetical protein
MTQITRMKTGKPLERIEYIGVIRVIRGPMVWSDRLHSWEYARPQLSTCSHARLPRLLRSRYG